MRAKLTAALAALLLVAGLCAAAVWRAETLLSAALGDGRAQEDAQAADARETTSFELRAEMAQEQARTRAAGWLGVVPAEEVAIDAPSGRLSATLFSPLSGEADAPLVIALHGGAGTARRQVADVACALSLAGCRVLTPDLYAHGRSEGERPTLGVRDAQDVRAWVEYALGRDPGAKIGLFGQDEGALAALLAAGEGLPDAVRCAALDSLPTDIPARCEALLSRAGYGGAVDEALFSLALARHLGTRPEDVDPAKSAARCALPLLLFCGTFDEQTPAWQAQDVAAAAQDARVVLAEGAAHGMARYQEEDAYYAALLGFYREHLGLGAVQ